MVTNFKINKSKISGSGPRGGILQQLIALIMGIITLPVRFGFLFNSLMNASVALSIGIGGIAKSFALGTKDLYILLFAILKITFKYILCIFSFVITTMYAGCIFIHPITLFFVMIHLFAMMLVDMIHDKFGVNFSFIVEYIEKYIKWPSAINTLCYTCFGKNVKIRDVLTDVSVISDIGKKISYDFNNVMPRYMKPSIPLGNNALKSLDKAIK